MGWGHENKCFIDPLLKDATEVAKWCKGGTARGFFYSDYYDKDASDIMIIFDGYGNTHSSMIQELSSKQRRDSFYECFIIANDGNIRLESCTKIGTISKFKEFDKYIHFLERLALLLGNPNPKVIPME